MVYIDQVPMPIYFKVFVTMLVTLASVNNPSNFDVSGLTVTPTPTLYNPQNYTFNWYGNSVVAYGDFKNATLGNSLEYRFFVNRSSYESIRSFYDTIVTANNINCWWSYCWFTYNYAYLDKSLSLTSVDPLNPTVVDPVPDYPKNSNGWNALSTRLNELYTGTVNGYYSYRGERLIYSYYFNCYFLNKC